MQLCVDLYYTTVSLLEAMQNLSQKMRQQIILEFHELLETENS